MTDKTIATPYDPEKVIGEWGWLWVADEDYHDEGVWLLVATYEDDDDDLRIVKWNTDDGWSDDTPRYKAEHWRGQPYLPLSQPACAPDAGLLVTVRLPDAASVSYSVAKGEKADETRALVLACMNPGGANLE
jgi:hypothetical protein